MKLAGHELITSLALKQKVTSPSAIVDLKGVRLHLLRVGSPAGTIFARLLDSGGSTIISSSSRTITALGSGNNWYGYVPFDLECQLAASTTYYIALGCAGYTFAEAAHVAWIADWNFTASSTRLKNALSYTAAGPVDAPLDYEFWEKRLVTKGTYP